MPFKASIALLLLVLCACDDSTHRNGVRFTPDPEFVGDTTEMVVSVCTNLRDRFYPDDGSNMVVVAPPGNCGGDIYTAFWAKVDGVERYDYAFARVRRHAADADGIMWSGEVIPLVPAD